MIDTGVQTGFFGSEPMISLSVGASRLDVALLGATPLRWLVDLEDGLFDVLDGYVDSDELRAQNGVRNGVLAPFCNRVRDGRYTFDGVEHDLLPGALDRTVYHGLTRLRPFTVADVGTTSSSACVTLRCSALVEEPAVGYPFAVEVDVTYQLGPSRLAVKIGGTNRGGGAAPFAAGWHPYFRLPGVETIDALQVSLAATRQIRTDDDLIPLPGSASTGPVMTTGYHWAPLGPGVIDTAYVLEGGGDSALVRDPRSGVRLVLAQDGGLVHLFTGDTLVRGRRSSLAVEPVEVMTDAFNRADCAEAIRLEPGGRRTFGFAVRVE